MALVLSMSELHLDCAERSIILDCLKDELERRTEHRYRPSATAQAYRDFLTSLILKIESKANERSC